MHGTAHAPVFCSGYTPPGEKNGGAYGAAKFREETSKKADSAVRDRRCCEAEFRPLIVRMQSKFCDAALLWLQGAPLLQPIRGSGFIDGRLKLTVDSVRSPAVRRSTLRPPQARLCLSSRWRDDRAQDGGIPTNLGSAPHVREAKAGRIRRSHSPRTRYGVGILEGSELSRGPANNIEACSTHRRLLMEVQEWRPSCDETGQRGTDSTR